MLMLIIVLEVLLLLVILQLLLMVVMLQQLAEGVLLSLLAFLSTAATLMPGEVTLISQVKEEILVITTTVLI